MFTNNEIPIVGVLRGVTDKDIKPLVDICKKIGLKYLEITMNTKEAVKLIYKMKEIGGDGMCIGAGTVLGKDDLREALSAGAEFIVTPSVVEDVIRSCSEEKIPVFPGALTPTEVHRAWEMGATMVKLFPIGVYGPSYIKMLKGPFNTVKIMAVGGVDEKNIGEYFRYGADAAAFGSSIIRKDWLNNNRYDIIEERLTTLVNAYLGIVSV